MMGMLQNKPRIKYPVQWSYRIIGESSNKILEAIHLVMEQLDYQIQTGRSSKNGRFVSHTLHCIVFSDEHRLALYEELSSHPDIKIVL